MRALKCRECGREYPLEATHVCEFDFGPLEVVYDYDKIRKSMTKAALAKRPEDTHVFKFCSAAGSMLAPGYCTIFCPATARFMQADCKTWAVLACSRALAAGRLIFGHCAVTAPRGQSLIYVIT